jgi:hypothetical protein
MIEKPKKERRFLKTLGRVGEILIQEVLIKVGSSLIKKIGGKKTLPSILFLFLSISIFAQYPATGNKQRLGYQTTGDGLVWRGLASDTISLKSSTINNAYIIIDTLQNVMYNYIKTKGGWQFSNGDTVIINNNFTQPFDSLFFKTSVSPNNVDTAKMRWDSELGTVVLGMYDQVPNELGFKNFWLVKNQTGSTITKGSLVYANGTLGASGRITVAKFIANGTIDAKYLLGITAHDLSNGEDGYVISFGKIRQVNTDTFADGAILYPSPTTAGVWTDVEPIAPNLDMPIGFCINSSLNNGTIAIRVASGYKLSELHDLQITSPVDRASLYYRGGLWRDTTAALLVSDTASMLTNYLRTGVAASTYLTQSNASSTYLPLTGGTLTGALSGTTGTFTTRLGVGSVGASSVPTLFTSGSGDQEIHFTHSDNLGGRKVSLRLTNNHPSLYTFGGLIYAIQGEGLNQYNRMTLGINTTEVLHLTRFSRVGIMNNSPSYTLDVNGTLRVTGNSLIGGTLGVTGATTLSGALTVNNATVFNEGSDDFDTRIESSTNANMVFVDAGLDRVGIGTGTPSKTLDVNGEVKIATVTATPTALLGKDANNVVGEVTDINQSGVMKVGSITENTSSVGIINVPHGLSYTPTKVIATIGQQSSYVIVCHGITSTNLNFTIYDSTDGTALDNVSVGFFWIAFK